MKIIAENLQGYEGNEALAMLLIKATAKEAKANTVKVKAITADELAVSIL